VDIITLILASCYFGFLNVFYQKRTVFLLQNALWILFITRGLNDIEILNVKYEV